MKYIKSYSLKNKILILFLILNSYSIADGLIVIQRPTPGPNPFPLEVVYHNVSVTIKDHLAVTSIDQSFFNPTSNRLEGYYIFPVPENAVINNFQMEIDGKFVTAELLDADKARKIYEDIVRQMRDPALLEYGNQGLFKVRIFPIEPNSEKNVKISYSEIINKDFGMFEYLYPLNTEKFSAKPLKNISVNVKIETEEKLKNIYSPTHNIEIIRDGDGKASVSYEEENVKPDIDFKLYYNTDNSKIGMSLLSYKPNLSSGDKNRYFFLSISPEFNTDKDEILPKDITFVLDVSGSMAGDKIRKAKNALLYCINNLEEEDRFNVIRFSTEADVLFSGLKPAEDEYIKSAEKFIEDLRAIGGTNIEEALSLAIAQKVDLNRPNMVIFITDGKPTIGETNESKLLEIIKDQNSNRIRIFTFGIGNDINTHLLDKITQLTNSSRTYISPEEDIEIKISQFFDKVQSPVLTDLELMVGDNIRLLQVIPQKLPDIFKGSDLIIFGRYNGEGKSEIKLTGKILDKKMRFSKIVEFASKETNYDFIPPLWASRRIGYLLDLIRLHGESNELVGEITDLARTFGIVTPYTSYLILEDEKIRLDRREIVREFQTLGNSEVAAAPAAEKYKLEYDAFISMNDGEEGVIASEEFRDLNEAINFSQTQQGKSRLNYVDNSGSAQNLTRQVKHIMGRAFYQADKFWIDSELQKKESAEIKKIKFASDEYFELFYKKNEINEFLALGQNVRFFFGDTVYEIYN